MAALELSDLVTGFAAYNKDQQQKTGQMASMQAGRQELANAQATATSKLGQNSALINTTAKTATMEATNGARKVATAMGSNMMAVDQIMTSLAADLRQTASQYEAAQDRVTAIESNNNLLSSPIGWLNDILNGDEARAVRDGLQEKFKTTHAMLQGLNSATQQTAITQQAIANTMTDASIAAESENLALQAQIKAQQAKIEGLGYGIASINLLKEQGAQTFNNTVQLYNMQRQEQQFSVNMEMRKKEFEQRQRVLTKEMQDDAAWTDIVNQINIVNKQLDRPEMPASYIRANYNSTSQQGAALRDLHYMGFNAEQTGELSYGATASEAASNLAKFGANVPQSWNSAVNIHKETQQELAKTINALSTVSAGAEPIYGLTPANIENPTALKTAYELIAAQKTEQYYNSSGSVATKNILSANPELAATPFAQQVLGTLTASGDTKPEPARVFSTGVALLEKGELEFNALVEGMAEYYETSAALETTTGGFLQLGLPGKVSVESTLPLGEATTGVNGWMKIVPAAYVVEGFKDLFNINNYDQAQAKDVLRTSTFDLTDEKDISLAIQLVRSNSRAEEFRKAASE